jgi:hypothetical protein
MIDLPDIVPLALAGALVLTGYSGIVPPIVDS